jgi:hypothetical protein
MKPTTIKNLQDEFNAITQRIDDIDLPGKAKHRAESEAHHASISTMELSPAFDTWKRSDEAMKAHRTMQEAVTAHQRAESLVRDLQPMADRLETLLSAGKLATQSGAAMTAATSRLEAAQAAVSEAQGVVSTIAGMIETESTAFDLERDHHTAALLATIKTGGDAKGVTAPNRERLASLERALEAAQTELASAVAAERTAKDMHAEAAQQVRVATAVGTGLNHELALRDYVETLRANRKANRNAYGNDFPIPNIKNMSEVQEGDE